MDLQAVGTTSSTVQVPDTRKIATKRKRGTASGRSVQVAKPALSLRGVAYIKDMRISEYIYADRFVNYLNALDLHKVLGELKPNNSGLESMKIAVYRLRQEQVAIFSDGQPTSLKKHYITRACVRFCVHPSLFTMKDKEPFLDTVTKGKQVEWLATPTSSSRTVVMIDPKMSMHFLKTHAPFQLDDKSYKILSERTIRHSVQVSKDLCAAKLSRSFAFFRESIGVSLPNTDDDKGWGYIVREMEASPAATGKTRMIPVYSLFSPDQFHPEERPLLCQLIDQSGEDPKEYMMKTVMFPIFDCWVEGIKKLGFIFGSHGQNTVLEFDETLKPTGRIIHRDFEIDVDAKIRQALGLSVENFKSSILHNTETDTHPKGAAYSLVYDNNLGRHLFDKLAKFMEQYYKVPEADLLKDFLAHFCEKFPDFKDYFVTNDFYRLNPGWYKTDNKPKWRPLIEERALFRHPSRRGAQTSK